MKLKLQKEEDQENRINHAGRPKGSLNKKTIEKINSGEILDPRIYSKKHYKHPGRPKGSKTKQVTINKVKVRKITEQERLENCKKYAIDWCYLHNAELFKYSVDVFVFRYKNDPTSRRYQIGYDINDYPEIWLPFTDNKCVTVEM